MKFFLITLTIISLFQSQVFSQCQTLDCTIPSSSTELNIDNLTNVTIAAGQVVKINNMNGSGPIVNHGTLYLPNGIISRSITNYGTIIIGGNASIQNNSFLNNEQTGRVCVLGSILINEDSYVVNNGTISIASNLHFNGLSRLFNADNGCMTVGGNISMDSNSSHCNSGEITVLGSVTVTNGGSFSACTGFAPGGGVVNQNNNGSYVVSSLCANCIGPLGATLTDFYVNNTLEGNAIYWTTSNERNIHHYSLHHSTNGFSWEVIHTEESKEEAINNYYFLHKTNFEGENYYRLTWIDTEDFMETSEIIVGHHSHKSKKIVQKVNLLGQTVDEYYRGVVIIQYADGSTEKQYVN